MVRTMPSPIVIVLILLTLACVAWLCLGIVKGRFRFQYSLRSMFILTAVVALVFGLISYWPSHVATLRVPRIEAKPGYSDATRDAFDVDIAQRWGRTTIRVTPREGLGEATKAELFWLESDNLHHVTIADHGKVLATAFPGPSQWPLLIGVVEYHPKDVFVTARWLMPDGRNGGGDGFYNGDDPQVNGKIEIWGQALLGRIRRDMGKR